MANLNPITRKEAILNGDDVTPLTREEYFAKNAVSGGGSGGGVPTPTSEDVGKVLTVTEDAEHSTQKTLVPVQDITVADGTAELLDVTEPNMDSFNVGDTAELTISQNGSTDLVNLVVVKDGAEKVFASSNEPIAIICEEGTWLISGLSDGEYSVGCSATVTRVTASWQAAGGGGGTVFHVLMDSSGSFSEIDANAGDIYAAVKNGPVSFISSRTRAGGMESVINLFLVNAGKAEGEGIAFELMERRGSSFTQYTLVANSDDEHPVLSEEG